MRLGISTSVIQRGKTGVAQYVFALLRGLLAQNGPHKFVLFVLEEDRPLFKFAMDACEFVNVPERFRAPVRNILWHQRTLPALVRSLRLDVLHVPSYRRMLWPRPCALVATIHDLAPFHVANKYDWKRMLYGRVVARRLARRQDRIIAISKNTAADINRFFGLAQDKVSVVYNGLDHRRFLPAGDPRSDSPLRAQHNLQRPFFLYLARIEHPGKNHTRLISAFESFKQRTGSDWQLVFGGSDWHGAEVVHSAIQRSKVASDIRSLGFVREEDLPGLYRAADAMVYPSLYEGFGLPPLEAMACGCPVISSTRGSLGEVVGDAAALVDPEDVVSIAAQLEAVAAGGGLRARLREAGLKQAAKFDWDRTAAETLAVYQAAAQRK